MQVSITHSLTHWALTILLFIMGVDSPIRFSLNSLKGLSHSLFILPILRFGCPKNAFKKLPRSTFEIILTLSAIYPLLVVCFGKQLLLGGVLVFAEVSPRGSRQTTGR